VTVVGDRVRIERDETLYPSKGTWPQFRGRVGTMIEINLDKKRPHLTEYGVVFGNVIPRTDGRGTFVRSGDEPVTWFKAYEIRPAGRTAVRHARARSTAHAIDGAAVAL
jgi:hypothetical protein